MVLVKTKFTYFKTYVVGGLLKLLYNKINYYHYNREWYNINKFTRNKVLLVKKFTDFHVSNKVDYYFHSY